MMLSCFGREKALLEVILHERSDNGEIETYQYDLTGHFSAAGTTAGAEGTVVQVTSIHHFELNNEQEKSFEILSNVDQGGT